MLTSVEGRKRRSTNPTVSEELEGEYIIGVRISEWLAGESQMGAIKEIRL